MNLLFFIHNMTGGGAERVMSIIANEFAKNDHNVTLAIMEQNPVISYKLAPSMQIRTLRNKYPKASKSLLNKVVRHTMDLMLPLRMRMLAKELAADYVVSFITKYNIEVIKAFKGSKYPVIVSEHTNVTRKIDSKINALRDKYYPYAAVVTVLTQRDFLLWKDKFPNVVLLPNPCTPTSVNINQERRKVVFTAGRVREWEVKGYDNLIKAWSLICHKFPDWSLEIAGDYTESSLEKLNKIIRECNAINVRFLGFREDVNQLMATSEVYCLSSRVEGLPMSLLEAMSAGCCCVSFDCTTGPSDIIINGVNGLLVKDQDINDLAAKLELTMSDDNYRRTLAKNNDKSLTKFSLSVIFNKWINLLKTTR